MHKAELEVIDIVHSVWVCNIFCLKLLAISLY